MPRSAAQRPVIGIMGVGVVGDAVRHYFDKRGHDLRVYDPYRDLGSQRDINEADVVFVCVPTPYNARGGFDDGAVLDAVSVLSGSKTVVIKSTVLPGTTEAYQTRFPQHSFLFNPEFLREASARADMLAPDRQIVGYTARSRHLAEQVLALLPDALYKRIMTAREAEMTKYMTNTFLAVKVTFANEMFDMCEAIDADYEVVREGVAADARIAASHLDVNAGGYRGFGGKCLPKDTKALLDLAGELGVSLHLLRTADAVNAELLPADEHARSIAVLPLEQDEPEERAA